MTGGPHSPLLSIGALRPRQREGQFAERSQSPSFPPEAVDRNGSRRACGLIIARFAAEGALFSRPSECGNVLCLKWETGAMRRRFAERAFDFMGARRRCRVDAACREAIGGGRAELG